MDPESKKFGSGARELTGAVDLISHFKLLPHHEFFCKRSLPISISDSQYLCNVVGSTEIRKGEGMQLDQIIQNTSQDSSTRIKSFAVEVLREAFQLKETKAIDLPLAEMGTPTVAGNSNSESKEKARKRKKCKDRGKEKDKEHKKHKHRHKDKDWNKDKDRKKDRNGHHDSGGDYSKKHHEKKRKHDGNEDLNGIHRHKKSEHKNSKVDKIGAIKVAG